MHNIIVSAEHLLPGDCWTEDSHPDNYIFYVVYKTERYDTYMIRVRMIAYKDGHSRQTDLNISADTRLVVDRPE